MAESFDSLAAVTAFPSMLRLILRTADEEDEGDSLTGGIVVAVLVALDAAFEALLPMAVNLVGGPR